MFGSIIEDEITTRLSVYHSDREHKFRKSREPLKLFSQNLVLYVFRAREDNLDRSQPCKKLGCLSDSLFLDTTLVNVENRWNGFHITWYCIYFGHENAI